MKRKSKIILILLASVTVVTALWCPYESVSVPEWTVQIIDVNGRPLKQVHVTQEWIDPIDDGIVKSDSRDTDADGRVTFPGRRTQNRLIIRIVDHLSPDAYIVACWQDPYGDVNWPGPSRSLPGALVLRKGSCPYG